MNSVYTWPWIQRATIAALIFAATEAIALPEPNSPPDFLEEASRNAAALPPSSCNNIDAAHFVDSPQFKGLIAVYGLASVKLTVECGPKFRTTAWRYGGGYEAVVQYPPASKTRIDDYLTPFAHELGHIVQIRMAGSQGQLENLFGTKRIELGADFLAGYALYNLGGIDDISKMAINLNMVGGYTAGSDDHGTPLDRANAFRLGYEYTRQNGFKSPELALIDFHKRLYGKIESKVFN